MKLKPKATKVYKEINNNFILTDPKNKNLLEVIKSGQSKEKETGCKENKPNSKA